MKLKGTVTALITPFANNVVDKKGLADNIDFQMAQGINGILLLGTTGEASTLSREEQTDVISIGVDRGKGRVPIWVGTGSYCTRQTIEKTQIAKDLGADVALVVTPYYNKPSQEGIYRHFEAIATKVDIPLVVYNIPGRSGTNIETTTLLRIAGLPNVIGVKEASGNLSQVGDIFHTILSQHPEFLVFSGDDVLTLPMMALGAVGVISVVSNLVPDRMVALTCAALAGEFALAKKIHYELLPLYQAAFIETNPVPIKTAMTLCGIPSGNCRLPLHELAPKNLEHLKNLLLRMQFIKN